MKEEHRAEERQSHHRDTEDIEKRGRGEERFFFLLGPERGPSRKRPLFRKRPLNAF
jgi:hypothetical protein